LHRRDLKSVVDGSSLLGTPTNGTLYTSASSGAGDCSVPSAGGTIVSCTLTAARAALRAAQLPA
jgi:hypothetical protein